MTESLEILNKVDSFYNSAWNKLVIVGTLCFAIVGIIVPLIIQWYQKNLLKIREEILKTEIKNEISNIKTEIIKEISDLNELKFQNFKNEIDILVEAIDGKTMHLQSNMSINAGDFAGAFAEAIHASKSYIKTKDYSNLNIMLQAALSYIDNLTNSDIDEIKITSNCDIDDFLNTLGQIDDKYFFLPTVRDFQLKLSRLRKAE